MTDQRLRAVERDQAAGVASEDAVLTERLRAGTLTSRRVELAAYCGHEPSWRVTAPPMRKVVNGLTCCCGSDERDSEHGHGGVDNYTHNFVHACEYYKTECTCDVTEHWAPAWREPVPHSFAKWLKGLYGRFETECDHDVAMTLARVAAARLALEAWTRSGEGRTNGTTIAAVIDAAATWAACPCEHHERAWLRAWLNSANVMLRPVPPATARLPRDAAAALWDEHNDRLPLAALCCVVGAGTPDNLPRQHQHGGVVRAAMEQALITWALA